MSGFASSWNAQGALARERGQAMLERISQLRALEQRAADKSAEARICESAFRAIRPADLPSLLRDCASGRELIALGHTGDVDHAARLDAYRSVPVLRHGWFVTD